MTEVINTLDGLEETLLFQVFNLKVVIVSSTLDLYSEY